MVTPTNNTIGRCSRNCTKKNGKGYCIDTLARIVDGKCDSIKEPITGKQAKLF